MCDRWLIEGRDELHPRKLFTDFRELFVEITAYYYFRFLVLSKYVLGNLYNPGRSILCSLTVSWFHIAVEDVYAGASHNRLCPA